MSSLIKIRNRYFVNSPEKMIDELIPLRDGVNKKVFRSPFTRGYVIACSMADDLEQVDEIDFQDLYMRMNKQRIKAERLIEVYFKDKKCLAGKPYINHLKEVSKNTQSYLGEVIGLLHDMLEDTEITSSDLYDLNFDRDIIEAIELLTKPKDVDYLEYIHRIKYNPYATEVKIADLIHNSDLSRLDSISEEDLERKARYQKALLILTGGDLDKETTVSHQS